MKQLGEPDPEYVRARRALLDALDALGSHRRAAILVGAQAIYLHVGDVPEALSPFTIDADLALNPTYLSDDPALETALERAGFRRRDQPGLWFTPDGVEVDLLVPASIAGRGSRGVDLGPCHDRLAAMRANGLEAALIDNAAQPISSLDPNDRRHFTIAVAGPGALLVAKLHKIGERADRRPDRLKNKDAWDTYLLLRETQTATLAATLRELRAISDTSPATEAALRYLRDLFTSERGQGVQLLRAAVEGLEGEETIVQSCLALVSDLVADLA